MKAREIDVRPYVAADRGDVVALWQLVFPDDPPHNAPELVIDRKLATDAGCFLVAEVDGRLVGTVLGGYDGHRGWIYHLAAHPDHRRRGIGGQLVRAAELVLVRHGCPKINLQIRAGNAEVRAFYESVGYSEEARISMGKRVDSSGTAGVGGR